MSVCQSAAALADKSGSMWLWGTQFHTNPEITILVFAKICVPGTNKFNENCINHCQLLLSQLKIGGCMSIKIIPVIP